MARVTVEDCLDKLPNRMELVILAAKRTRQLLEGADPLIINIKGNKEPIIALREISDGKVELQKVEFKEHKPRRRRRISRYIRSQES